jgi:hypothetical protein
MKNTPVVPFTGVQVTSVADERKRYNIAEAIFMVYECTNLLIGFISSTVM